MATEQHTLRDLLTVQSRRFERKNYLEFGGERYSYSEMDEKTDRVATGLHRMGLASGDEIAILLSNRPELIFFLLGAPKIGIVPVLIDPRWPDSGNLLTHCGAEVVISESAVASSLGGEPGTGHWILVDDPSFDEAPFHGLRRGNVLGFWPDLTSEDTALITFTRGMRSPRKGVVLNHRNLLSNCRQLVQPFRMDSTDRFYCAIPLNSSFAVNLLLIAPGLVGGTCILEPDLRQSGPRGIQESEATVLAGGPAFYSAIVGAGEFGGCAFPSLRLALCTYGSVGEGILRRFEEPHGAIMVEAYGLTEATALTCANPYTGLRKAGSIGLALSGQECKILDERGVEVPVGEPGEIVVRGPNVMKEYYGDHSGTARTLRDGWLHTGDVGYADPDGYYFLSHKSK